MDYISIQKNVGHSPRKLRLVADMVRKMRPQRALEVLRFTKRAAALDLIKAIETALSNIKEEKRLVFKKLEINEGLKMKRHRLGTAGRGRIRPYKKRFSHIKIVLSEEEEEKKRNRETVIKRKKGKEIEGKEPEKSRESEATIEKKGGA